MDFKLLREALEAGKRLNNDESDRLMTDFLGGIDLDAMPDHLAARYYALLDDELEDVSEDAVDRVMNRILGKMTSVATQSPTLWQCIERGLATESGLGLGLSAETIAKIRTLNQPLKRPPQSWRELSLWMDQIDIPLSDTIKRQLHRAAGRGWDALASGGRSPVLGFEAAREDQFRS